MAQYDNFAEKYFSNRQNKNKFDFNRDLEVPAMIKMIGDINNKKVLDIGCGFADHLKKLSSKKPNKLVGFDISSEMIDFTKKLKIPNCKLYVGDMNKKLKHKNEEFDLIFSSLAVHYISKNKLNKLFAEINRVLKKGGEFIFSTGHPIFNLRKQTIKELIENGENGNILINIDYFNEKKYFNEKLNLALYNFTFETLIKTALNNSFEIIDYKEIKPISSVKNFKEYEYLTQTPSFIIFKLKKKEKFK